MLKLCRRYLHWVQNSVLEGEITEVKLKELEHKARKILDPETDSLLIFAGHTSSWMEKRVIGREKNDASNFL